MIDNAVIKRLSWNLHLTCGHIVYTTDPALWKKAKTYCATCRKKAAIEREELITK